MLKRIFIVHGWGGNPNEGWFPWLKRQLEQKGIKVSIPKMPDSDTPTIIKWLSHLKKTIGKVDEDTFLVGHSIGCQAILRYLEQLPKNSQIGGAIFVAGWVHLNNLSSEELKIAEPWFAALDWGKIRMHTRNSVAIFSDNDPWVPLSDADIFAKELKAKIFIDRNKGHYSEEHGVIENPRVLNELKKILIRASK